jgi:hypothetical protein
MTRKSLRGSKEPRPYDEYKGGVVSPSRKKSHGPRGRFTHFEIRRGKALRLRITVANDALAEIGEELSALIKRVAPSPQPAQIVEQPTVIEPVSGFVVTPQHVEHDDTYHAELREHLADLFGTLCDTGLETALDIARQERERRADGGN